MTTATDAAVRQQYLAFTLAGGEYAVGILKVKEILQYEEVTRVPSTPRSIRGVLNLRGNVVPVVDLAVKFGLPETDVTKRTCVLVVEATLGGAAAVVGFIADAVSAVIELGPDEIEPPAAFETLVEVDYLVGMGKLGKRFVLLLDVDAVLSADECAFALRRKPRIDSLWVNLLKDSGHHAGHIHPHSIISGTFYVEVPSGGGAIRFEDPRLPLMMAAPQRPDSFITIEPRPGLLLLWESWLRHEVLPGSGKGERLSISFNFA